LYLRNDRPAVRRVRSDEIKCFTRRVISDFHLGINEVSLFWDVTQRRFLVSY
jgi:hypothetical protein